MLKDKHATVDVIALGGGDREHVIPLPGDKGDAETAGVGILHKGAVLS